MNSIVDTRESLVNSVIRLLQYCKENDWAGYDPYDGLNSRIFRYLIFAQNKTGRLFFTQLMKRLPVNFRLILQVSKSHNPKGLALFSSALLKLSDIGITNGNDISFELLNRMVDLRAKNRPYFCWGYNFDWQSRKFLLPKYEPNIICTTFAGNALMDAYDRSKEYSFIEMALSAGQFILEGLNISETKEGICFSYTPYDRGQVHNANLLGAAFLARLYKITNENKFLSYALSSVKFSVSKQNADGSWPYGEDKTQKWIDNFHTGYNLVALKQFSIYTGNKDFQKSIEKGFNFYRENFFTDKGLAKYYHYSIYPIDIHSIAQSIITLLEFKELNPKNLDLAISIYFWAIDNMQSKKGFFYYQKKQFYKNKISYMRWSQAWMLYALVTLIEEKFKNELID